MKKPVDGKEDRIRLYIKTITQSIMGSSFSNVALSLGLGRNTLSQYVSGRTSISMKNLISVCSHLDLPLVVLDRKEFPSPENIAMWKTVMSMPEHEIKSMLEHWRDLQNDQMHKEAMAKAKTI